MQKRPIGKFPIWKTLLYCPIMAIKARQSGMQGNFKGRCIVFLWIGNHLWPQKKKTNCFMNCCKKKVVNTKETHTRTVAIAGSVQGCGVTHLAVSLANYTASGLGEKTAYIEASGHGEMSHWKNPGEMGYFTEKRVHYYPDVKRKDIPIILNRDYERVFFDFGEKYLLYREEILRCDIKIFLINLNIWQIFAAKKMLKELKEPEWGGLEPLIASAFVFPKEKQKIEKEFHISIIEIPKIPDSFAIPGRLFAIMKQLLAYTVTEKKKRSLKLARRKR